MEPIKRCCTLLFGQVYNSEANERKPAKGKPMESPRRLSAESRLVSHKQPDRFMRLRLQIQSLGFIW